MTRALTDLASAVQWFATEWEDRRQAIPLRLHYLDDVEPESLLGTPEVTPQFMNYLSARAMDTVEVTETVDCRHVSLVGPDTWQCRDCAGSGYYERRRPVYRDPLAAALENLRRRPAPWPRGQVAPSSLLVELALSNFSVALAADRLLIREDVCAELVVRAIGYVRSRFLVAPPVRVGWIDKSDAQRTAEMAAGTAA